MSDHTHCIYCGRALVDVEELSVLHDRSTGERGTVVWRQCPRFPKNGWMAMFRGTHESFQRDDPLSQRQYS